MTLEKIRLVRGPGVYVPGDDIDTDQIIPARFLLCVSFDALGDQLFRDARYAADGTPRAHPLNEPRHASATILLSGANFGCGSSREHAPQSLHKAGFRAVIAESFAEIFFGNATTLGIPCVTLPRADITKLAAAIEADPQLPIEVDLDRKEVRAGSLQRACELRESARDALLGGQWDPISQLLEGADQVSEVYGRLPYASW